MSAIKITRLLPAEIEQVFEAWTRGDFLSRWFVCTPGWTVRVTCEFRVGGRYRIEMEDGGRPVGVAYGTYLQIERPHRLVFTWTSEGRAGVAEGVVTIALRAAGDSTELTLTHDIAAESDAGRAHHRGWMACLHGLAAALPLHQAPSSDHPPQPIGKTR